VSQERKEHTRVALISDQHGNDVAFRAAVEDAERVGVDRFVCLGDVAQGGAQPAETLDRLAALGCETVIGNADAFVLTGEAFGEPVTPRHLEVREWTLQQLDERHLDQIRSFRPTVELELEGKRVLCFHGSPSSFEDVLLPESESGLEPWLVDADVLTGGHTHKQWARQIGRALFVNPGSVGLAYDHHQPEDDVRFDAVAEYALLTAGGSGPAVEFRRVPYSLDELREVVLGSGRPQADEHAAMYEPR
jgi:putative phosphoesterase